MRDPYGFAACLVAFGSWLFAMVVACGCQPATVPLCAVLAAVYAFAAAHCSLPQGKRNARP